MNNIDIIEKLRPINLSLFIDNKEGYIDECKSLSNMLTHYGIVVVRDPRVDTTFNDRFINLMEKYYAKPPEVKLKDAHPEIFYQLGVTPELKEKARPRCQLIKTFNTDQIPTTICPPGADPKWRYFWKIGPRPKATKFAPLHFEQVVPADFPQWADVMDAWGNKLLQAAKTIAEMAALGFGLKRDAFSSLMENAPHLLAPTGSDLEKHGERGTVFAHFHQDLNFITVHGKSNFPGLTIWLRDRTKMRVAVPDGCLLAQAGMQFEYLTGGKVLAGFHEVVVGEDTLKVVEGRTKENRSLWRVSSTFFGHIASDNTLEPLEVFEKNAKFPPILAGDQVTKEIKKIIVREE